MLLLASPRPTRTPALVPSPPARPAAGRPARGAGGRCWRRAALFALALAGYAAEVALHPLRDMLTWFDLRVYVAAGHTVAHAPGMLYVWPMMPRFQFTYTPFAALVFAAWAWVPWATLTWVTTAASVAALGLAVWLTLGGLGWRGQRRLAGALALSAVALWTEPVQRTLHLGQVELLLMALVIADLCLADRRWWKGIGIGLAAGVELVPLIFIPYLLLTRRFRQAVVATVTFGALAGAGFLVLPQASWQWWFGPDFLRAGRTGFVGFLANQSLRGMFTRQSGSLAGGLWWWAAAAGAGRGGRADHRCPAAPVRPAGARLAHLRAHRADRVAGELGPPLGVGGARARGPRRRRISGRPPRCGGRAGHCWPRWLRCTGRGRCWAGRAPWCRGD